jgi:hypothetical protein
MVAPLDGPDLVRDECAGKGGVLPQPMAAWGFCGKLRADFLYRLIEQHAPLFVTLQQCRCIRVSASPSLEVLARHAQPLAVIRQPSGDALRKL